MRPTFATSVMRLVHAQLSGWRKRAAGCWECAPASACTSSVWDSVQAVSWELPSPRHVSPCGVQTFCTSMRIWGAGCSVLHSSCVRAARVIAAPAYGAGGIRSSAS
eukprot:1646254-Pleurochrysis_carterae.AAC.2